MSESEKHNLQDLHAPEGAEEHHSHLPGHLDDGEPITDSDINYGSLIFIGVVGSLITIAIVFCVEALYWKTFRHEYFIKQVGKNYERNWQQFTALRAEQEKQLTDSHWTVPDKDLISIPLDEGIKQALLDETRKQSADLKQAATPPADATSAAAPEAAQAAAADGGESPVSETASATPADAAKAEEGK